MFDSDNEFNKGRGETIRSRRCELGLSVEEAAVKADVSVKSWYRYESGNPIRADKMRNVLSALKLEQFKCDEDDGLLESIKSIDEQHWAYSNYLAKEYDVKTAQLFAASCDIVLDEMRMDIDDLRRMPAGSHIGQLGYPMTDSLPEFYLTRYDYEFMYELAGTLQLFALQLKNNPPRRTSIYEVLALVIESHMHCYMEAEPDFCEDSSFVEDYGGDLLGMLFDDRDIEMYFDEDSFIAPNKGNVFHFDNWFKMTEF